MHVRVTTAGPVCCIDMNLSCIMYLSCIILLIRCQCLYLLNRITEMQAKLDIAVSCTVSSIDLKKKDDEIETERTLLLSCIFALPFILK